MITFSDLSAIIFMVAVIAAGIWSFRIGRYHIFYFLLCGLLPAGIALFIISIGDAYVKTDSYSPANSKPSYFSHFDLTEFSIKIITGIYFLLLITSIINFFIRKNKLSVKVMSFTMLIILAVMAFMIYAFSQFAVG